VAEAQMPTLGAQSSPEPENKQTTEAK